VLRLGTGRYCGTWPASVVGRMPRRHGSKDSGPCCREYCVAEQVLKQPGRLSGRPCGRTPAVLVYRFRGRRPRGVACRHSVAGGGRTTTDRALDLQLAGLCLSLATLQWSRRIIGQPVGRRPGWDARNSRPGWSMEEQPSGSVQVRLLI